MKFDKVIGEAQTLSTEFPQLKDDPAYADCVYWSVYSLWQRRDKSQLVKALQTHSQIDLIKATYNDNAIIAIRYIEFAFYCFDL